MADNQKPVTPVVENRKARAMFEIVETYEAGLSLLGSEVKSIRGGHVSLKEAYVKEAGGELYLTGCHINPFHMTTFNNHDPIRRRKLLLHGREIRRILGKIREKGFTCVPLKMYFRKNRVKLEIALARGKKVHDRREDIKKRDMKRDMEREMKDLGRR